MRILRFMLGVSLLALGCQADEPDADSAPSEGPTTAVEADEEAARMAGGARTCGDIEDSARKLLESYQACESDADCALTTVTAKCLGPFVCQPAVNKHENLDQLRRRAKTLAALHQLRCSDECVVARCVSPESQRAVCSPDTKRCERAYVPPPAVDANVPEPDAGGPTDPAASDPRFQCQSDADCAVKDVGNCCGYYPRCANVDATFERPSCEGRAGVCGFPSIESCACRQNTCLSMQGGQEI